MKTISLSLIGLLACAAAGGASSSEQSVSLTQEPLVMRLNKDEFRIAFGIDGARCAAAGCNGLISYRVDWKTADGTTRSEMKQVSYTVSPRARRTIAVDRQYFDTSEGGHMTDVIKVRVGKITCREGVDSLAL